jgi:hypothetical protein
VNIDYKFVNFPDMQYLMAGLSIGTRRCADVLDGVLTAFNEQSGISDQIVDWNAKGGNTFGPLSFPDRGRFIFDLTRSMRPGKEALWTAALLEKKDEKEKAPVVFISMRSPSLNIPMRLEIPLRAVMKGGPSLSGTYSVYLHALLADDGTEFVYYGITKRGWNIRFAEHTKAAVAEKSSRLFPRKLNELIEARVEQLSGKVDKRPKLAGIVSALAAVGLSKDSAMDAEEYLVEKYSLSSKHPHGLNMIPGGRAGMVALRAFSSGTNKEVVETEDRELAFDLYLQSHPQAGIPKPGVAEKWNDPNYAEAVICGRENRLSGDQVRRIRYLAAVGASVDQIMGEVGAIDQEQIQRVLAGRTYSRIK